MGKEVNRLQRLVDDLFTLAQHDSGHFQLKLEECFMGKIAQEVLAVSSPLAKAAGVNLEVEIDKKLPQVVCDKDRIFQVLLGFVDNALKHTSSDGKITIFTYLEHSQVTVGVKDNGAGIPPHILTRIFDRFYVADGPGRKKKGAGLGLSIAKEIIEAHGSKIKVESTLDKGTTFSFQLPTS